MKSMKSFWVVIIILFAVGSAGALAGEAGALFAVDPSKVNGRVDVRIYGQFLEHIFNSVHGGLWGDMVLNPCLQGGQFAWKVNSDGEVTQSGPGYFCYLPFGDAAWTDYEYTFEAFPEGGDGNVDVLDVGPFRYTDDQHFYHVRIGGKSRTLNIIERNGEKGVRLYSAAYGNNVPEKQWNQVRLRVEKEHIQVWVNGQLIVDFADSKDITKPALLNGKVGLNITSMRTRFRNLKVTTLDGGRVLFSGLPAERDLSIRPGYWDVMGGAGSVRRPETIEKNQQPWVIISCDEASGEFGVQQKRMQVVKGMEYRVSLTARSDTGARLCVRMVDESGVRIAEVTVGGITNEFGKFDFMFTSDRESTNAALQLVVSGRSKVDVGWVSLFAKSSLDCGGFRPDLLEAIRAQKPATIRYPGGCFASFYDWKDGVGPHEKRRYYPRNIWDDQDPGQMGTDEFMDLCRRVGAEPIIAINAGEGDLVRSEQFIREALDWMEYCNSAADTKLGKVRAGNGHPEPYNVKYWEIDNETWEWKVEKYAEIVKRFSRAMREKYPSVKILACGGYGYDDGGGSTKGWNQRLLDLAAKDFDFLSIHYYNGCPMEKYPWNHVTDPRRYEKYIRDEIGGMIRRSANTNLMVYCSEWGQMREDWPSGLYTGGTLNGFERISEIAPMSCPAVWLQTSPARWWSSSILFDSRCSYTTPQYLVGKLWRDHFAPNRIKVDGPEEPLNVVATVADDGKTVYVKIVNPMQTVMPVEFQMAKTFPVKSVVFDFIASVAGSKNSLEHPDNIKVAEGDIKVAGQEVFFAMPALSVGIVTVRR